MTCHNRGSVLKELRTAFPTSLQLDSQQFNQSRVPNYDSNPGPSQKPETSAALSRPPLRPSAVSVAVPQ